MALSQLSMLRAQVRTGSIPLRWRVRTAATELGAVDAELGSAPVIIVGAGAAGLGCATRLARAGVPFTLLAHQQRGQQRQRDAPLATRLHRERAHAPRRRGHAVGAEGE